MSLWWCPADDDARGSGRAATGHAGARPRGTAALAPGAVDVRLLAMTPRLDGLREDLPPNRARRAASSWPTRRCTSPTSSRATGCAPASSDRPTPTPPPIRCSTPPMRRGVPWASTSAASSSFPPRRDTPCTSSHPASPSTCTASRHSPPRARRSPTHPLPLPTSASRSISSRESPGQRTVGLPWWEAEGHGGRIAAILVDAACAMASLASDAGHFALARWGLERAGVVEPYSEALSRSAMELAAAEGDADRLRQEWRECQRRVDALDPGCSPSASANPFMASWPAGFSSMPPASTCADV